MFSAFFSRFMRLGLATFALMAWAGGACAGTTISLEGRDMLFAAEGNAAVRGSAARGWAPAAGKPFDVELFLMAAQAKEPYALQLPAGISVGDDEADQPKIYFNGDELTVVPLPRADGALFYVPSPYLREGRNTLRIEAPASAGAVSWTGTRMFSLLSTGEQVHFDMAFSDAPPVTRAEPPRDSRRANYDVQWYDVSWTPTMTSRVIQSSSVWMGAKSLVNNLQTVVLDFDANGGAMVIEGVDGGPSTPAMAYSVKTASDTLEITLPAPVAVGQEFRVRVRYRGTPGTGGAFGSGYNRTTHSGRSVIYTFSEPYKASTWWPCKDDMSDKATTMGLSVTVPSGAGWEVVTNGTLQSRTVSGSTETWRWLNAHPIATYLVSLCVSNYIYVGTTYTALDGVTQMPIKHAIYPENISYEGTGAAGTLAVMEFFAEKFGEFPFLDEKYYTASHASGSGMEHQTCTSMPARDVQDGRQRRNVHELAHSWFGDLITCKNFNHLWLNEGFATICEALWFEHEGGPSAYHSWVDNWTVSDSQPLVGPDSDNFAGSVAYRKGAWVLHMLRGMLGDDAFFDLLKGWASHPPVRYGNADSAQFEAFCEARTGRDLTAFFSQWLTRGTDVGTPGRPRYQFNANYNLAVPTLLSVKIDQVQGGAPYQMPIQLFLTDALGASKTVVVENTVSSVTHGVPLDGFVPVEMAFDPTNWVLKHTGLSINTCGLPKAEMGAYYFRNLQAQGASDYSSGALTWSVTGGSLPLGLTLSSGGFLSGTPTAAGSYTFTVKVQDSSSATRSTTLNLEVTASGVEDWRSL